MANPHLLPSSQDMVSAFVRDLSNVAAVFGTEGAKPIRVIAFFKGAAAVTWRVPSDCALVGVITSSHIVVSTTGLTYANYKLGNFWESAGIVYAQTTNSVFGPGAGNLRVPLFANQLITMDSDATGVDIQLYIEQNH